MNAKGHVHGCTEQMFTLRNILEQCTEWNRQLYVTFIDRGSLLQTLKGYGILQCTVDVIKCFCSNLTCCVGQEDVGFEVKTGVYQGCLLVHAV